MLQNIIGVEARSEVISRKLCSMSIAHLELPTQKKVQVESLSNTILASFHNFEPKTK
jgi:hypothetical protein